MSLDITLTAVRPITVFDTNITHNLGLMATEAGIYMHLWRPDELGFTHAIQLIEGLKSGLLALKTQPERFKKLNPSNGWGRYEDFVAFVEEYLNACEMNPDAEITISR